MAQSPSSRSALAQALVTRFRSLYRTAPAPCPYLPGRLERKLFTRLTGDMAPAVNDTLTQHGFRRSQNIAYIPDCVGCQACTSVRIVVNQFDASRSQKRVLRRNCDIVTQVIESWATDEQFDLLRRYLDERHEGGGMSEMTKFDYVAMVEDSAVNTQLVEFRQANGDGSPGALKGVALTDVLSDGLSMVYSFFDTQDTGRSLGTFMVLEHVKLARMRGLPHVYLGYFIAGCRKMSYKARFPALEACTAKGWVAFDREP